MYDRMPTLSEAQMTQIHDAAMNILSRVGVAFNESESLDIFKKNGFKVDGKTVYFSEKEVRGAIESAPQRFTLAARNPAKSVELGDEDFAFVPGYGAPFIIASDGQKRNSTMEDYDNFCKLVQTSKYIEVE